MKTYKIIKEIRAKDISSALKRAEKAKVIAIQETHDHTPTEELTPAIGFEVYQDDDDELEEYET